MRAINHALTGAVIGLSLSPLLAVPLALASHYVLDAVPHYGRLKPQLGSRRFMVELLIDAGLCASLVVVLGITAPAGWGWAALCAFVAAAPDFMWLKSFLNSRAGRPQPIYHNPLVKLHKRIQWFERPAGAVVEIGWAMAMIIVLTKLV